MKFYISYDIAYVEQPSTIDDDALKDKHLLKLFPKFPLLLLIIVLVFAAHKLKRGYQDKDIRSRGIG